MVFLQISNFSLLETIRMRGFDLEQQLDHRTYQDVGVRIVAIDNRSIAKYGQWPWPRTRVAELVDKIAQGQPRALGVDIVFSEPDRLSPETIIDELPSLPPSLAEEMKTLKSNDSVLAESFAKAPTVLGIGLSDTLPAAPGLLKLTLVREAGSDPNPFLPHMKALLLSRPELRKTEHGRGALYGLPDSDGILRRVSMFVVGQGHLLPTLTLEMWRVAAGERSIVAVADRHGVLGAATGNSGFPTDTNAYAFPWFTPSFEGRYVSARDLLDGSYDPARLHGTYVILAVTALGGVDQVRTPLALVPGAEVHAQLLECMLTGNLLWRTRGLDQLELALLICSGLLVTFVLPYRRPGMAAIGYLMMVVLLIGIEFTSFYFRALLVDGLLPALSSTPIFGVMLAANLWRVARDLELQRRHEARLEGEMNAARAIQMGLLPRHFPEPPEYKGVQLYASIDPARSVGGDLYDFEWLDDNRLSFAIADVSGKSVPAALFMAMTKEILRDATGRHRGELDRVFDEANAKISAAGNDLAREGANMMFVTVFAGVLDLATGMLAYINAGHDSPYLVHPGRKATELAGEGGPPLGTVDEFPYPVQKKTLAPGEMLLLYTDGVTEAQNVAHGFYEKERLEEILNAREAAGAREIVERVREDVRRFSAGAEQADDITVMAVAWLGDGSISGRQSRPCG